MEMTYWLTLTKRISKLFEMVWVEVSRECWNETTPKVGESYIEPPPSFRSVLLLKLEVTKRENYNHSCVPMTKMNLKTMEAIVLITLQLHCEPIEAGKFMITKICEQRRQHWWELPSDKEGFYRAISPAIVPLVSASYRLTPIGTNDWDIPDCMKSVKI